jgi:hypothetical protein
MIRLQSYRKLLDLYRKNRYSVILFLNLLSDYDLTSFKVIPRRVMRQNYHLAGGRLRCALKLLYDESILERGPLVKYNSRKVRTIRIHPSALVSRESLESFLIESAEREQRLGIAPLMSKPVKLHQPKEKKHYFTFEYVKLP